MNHQKQGVRPWQARTPLETASCDGGLFQDSLNPGRPQQVCLVLSAALASRAHALAGLRSAGAHAHGELGLAKFYAVRATTLALLGEVAR